MRPGSLAWWVARTRQARRHVTARVTSVERAAVAGWLSPDQLAMFDSMHVSDRRHGLDVVASLRTDGTTDTEVLLAGLLHDAGKGDTGLVPRVIHSLSQAYGAGLGRTMASLPGLRAPLERLRTHAETSASMAAAAGCSARTVDLIRWQDAPRDPEAGERLRLADEAN